MDCKTYLTTYMHTQGKEKQKRQRQRQRKKHYLSKFKKYHLSSNEVVVNKTRSGTAFF